MTCICAIADLSTVWMASDSAGSDSYSIVRSSSKKVFTKNNIVFGVAGSWRQLNLLQHDLSIPDHYETISDESYISIHVVNAIRDCFLSSGSSQRINEQEVSSVSLLLGYRGGIYHMNTDLGVLYITNGYDAIGSGDDVAKGALFATSWMSPKERLYCALSAAVEHTPFVRPPFVIEMLSAANIVKGAINA